MLNSEFEMRNSMSIKTTENSALRIPNSAL